MPNVNDVENSRPDSQAGTVTRYNLFIRAGDVAAEVAGDALVGG